MNMPPGKARVPAHKLRLPWKATELFAGFETVTLHMPEQERSANRSIFWRSICSEHDARHFYRHLINNGPELPWKMQDFLAGWLADEVNHARGFKILYHSLYGTSFDDIEKELHRRTIDFSQLAEFFGDLRSACLLFAYDELVTTRVYQLSIPFYERLGVTATNEWIRRLVYDEARHFRAMMRVIYEYCRDDILRTERMLTRIIDVDLAQDEYRGTFVLDHACPEFPFTKSNLGELVRRGIIAPLRNSTLDIAAYMEVKS